ncbi:MAG: ABC transporter permease [Gammaproteobacteria bacterium]|nr:ABC transporter permease [Gammaproteobacteria bacterium]
MMGFIGLWELAAVTGAVDAQFFPPPSHVAGDFVTLLQAGSLLSDILISSWRVLVGFALSAAVGIPLGILLGSSQALRWIVGPVISIIRPLPSLSWIPLSLLWLGIGETQKYAIVFMGTLAPLVVFVTDATLRVDEILLKAARNLGASSRQIMVEVVLPGALPSILSGLKVTLALAWTCIISAEMVGAMKGLGYLIWNAKDWGNTGQVIIGMLMISATVLVMDTIFRLIEAALLPWRRGESGR